jgi:hypothetical protein
LHGVDTAESDDKQLRHLAKILPNVVLPTPLVPEKMNA